ncbi:DNA-3-methyladenine glycosylase I [Brevundimonas sp. M20]|uniref:DNA-3-methyladenine glycosylase I n=1 Tax=Brevundimonas sp. M20 TaxID=2591463 RepID=UPI001146FF70|nr:DNA-3-methyladenine glycosylase I [Brevundimonas sp. M20]QDH72819.1 DNA-3-methyladenine glycosylase I [Brevundimonas sp. M20]
MTDSQTDGRCGWCGTTDALYIAYHDEEWGVPEYDPRALWEKLILDGFQAGLAWITILRKREGIRDAFDNFDPEKVAAYGEADIERLLNDPRIIRSRAKINAAIRGAQIWLEMRDNGEDFSAWLWSFVGGAPIQNDWSDFREAPVKTPESEAMARALKKRGFNFCGPVIVYAFMQATGLVNDHPRSCFRYEEIRAMGASRTFTAKA